MGLGHACPGEQPGGGGQDSGNSDGGVEAGGGGGDAVLARSRLLAVTSVHEGGANVVTEALAFGVPVISTEIPGSTGLLGTDYPGYFRVGDPVDLARVLGAAEEDKDGFYRLLRQRCAELRYLADPARERATWAALLAELYIEQPGQPASFSRL